MDPWRLDSRFEFLKCHGSYRVVRYQEVPGTAVVARGVPRLRGTVSGCLSSTKVFHRGREHATLLASVTGRRRPKAVTELTAISEATVDGRLGSVTRDNWVKLLAVPSTGDPGRPLSPLVGFVRRIFDPVSTRLRRRLGWTRRVHHVDFETTSCRVTWLMNRALAWNHRSHSSSSELAESISDDVPRVHGCRLSTDEPTLGR